MIYNVDLLPCEHITVALDEAYSFYRRTDKKSHPNSPEAVIFRHKYNCSESDIRFLGCLDTVAKNIEEMIPKKKDVELFIV